MADTEQVEEHLKKKREGTPLFAVMDESRSSCAGSPACELHCPYRVWVDNDSALAARYASAAGGSS
jgi:hypothetical protein